DASHRVRAAINALIITTNTGDIATMDVVYKEVAPLSDHVGVRVHDRLKLEMIYETIRGDIATGAEAARELLLLAERTLPLRHRLPVMLNCASALRRGGRPGESEALCESLFNFAVTFGCYSIAAEACNRLIEMHGDSGRVASAATWVTNYRRLRRPATELESRRSLRIAMARVHLWRSQWDAATTLLEPKNSPPLWDDEVMLFRSAALATKIRLEVGRGARRAEIATWVRKLSSLNNVLRTMGAQDYECYSLYLGIRHVGNTEAAAKLLETYVAHERRDTKPLAPEIIAELSRL